VRALYEDAAKEDVVVHGVQRVTGMWEGHLEPATSVWVKGAPEAVQRLAARLGRLYNQDGVMVVTPDQQGEGRVWRLPGVASNPDLADRMRAHGLVGGRLVGDDLEIADPDGSASVGVRNLAASLATEPRQYTAEIRFMDRRDYEGEAR